MAAGVDAGSRGLEGNGKEMGDPTATEREDGGCGGTRRDGRRRLGKAGREKELMNFYCVYRNIPALSSSLITIQDQTGGPNSVPGLLIKSAELGPTHSRIVRVRSDSFTDVRVPSATSSSNSQHRSQQCAYRNQLVTNCTFNLNDAIIKDVFHGGKKWLFRSRAKNN